MARDNFKTMNGHYMTASSDERLLQPLPYNGVPWKAHCGISHASTIMLDHPLVQKHFHPPPLTRKCLYVWSGMKIPLKNVPIYIATMSMSATVASTSMPSPTIVTRLFIAPIKKGDQPNQQDDSL